MIAIPLQSINKKILFYAKNEDPLRCQKANVAYRIRKSKTISGKYFAPDA
jgi:hypothetical protein